MVPGTADVARFNTGTPDPYTVTFNGAYTNQAAIISTETLSWDLQGNTYTLTGAPAHGQ